jgi:hypothetical protein
VDQKVIREMIMSSHEIYLQIVAREKLESARRQAEDHRLAAARGLAGARRLDGQARNGRGQERAAFRAEGRRPILDLPGRIASFLAAGWGRRSTT